MPANRTIAFSAVAAEGVSRSDYRADLHERVDGYVAEYMSLMSVSSSHGKPTSWREVAGREVDVQGYVLHRCRQELFGTPIVGWIAFMLAKAFISYLVERTLHEILGDDDE